MSNITNHRDCMFISELVTQPFESNLVYGFSWLEHEANLHVYKYTS